MELTRAAISRNRVTFVALAVVALGGLITFFNLPRNLDPGFIVRWAVVMTNFPGASPERVEMLITDKIEKAIQEMPEVKVVASALRISFLRDEKEIEILEDCVTRQCEPEFVGQIRQRATPLDRSARRGHLPRSGLALPFPGGRRSGNVDRRSGCPRRIDSGLL